MLNTVDAIDSNMQWLCNVSTPSLMNPFKSSHSARNGAFRVGKVHLQAATVSRETTWLQLVAGTWSVHSTALGWRRSPWHFLLGPQQGERLVDYWRSSSQPEQCGALGPVVQSAPSTRAARSMPQRAVPRMAQGCDTAGTELLRKHVFWGAVAKRHLANSKDRNPKQTQINKIEVVISMCSCCVKKTSNLQSSNKYQRLSKLSSCIYQKVHVAPYHPNYK